MARARSERQPAPRPAGGARDGSRGRLRPDLIAAVVELVDFAGLRRLYLVRDIGQVRDVLSPAVAPELATYPTVDAAVAALTVPARAR
jgi:hypothetical protein